MQATKVFLNGKWIGVHSDPDTLKHALLQLRRSNSLSPDVSVAFDHALNEIRIYNDWGRVCRPLFVVESSKLKLTRHEIVRLQVCPSDMLAANFTCLCADRSCAGCPDLSHAVKSLHCQWELPHASRILGTCSMCAPSIAPPQEQLLEMTIMHECL